MSLLSPCDPDTQSRVWATPPGMTPVPIEMDRTLPSRLILSPDGTLGSTP